MATIATIWSMCLKMSQLKQINERYGHYVKETLLKYRRNIRAETRQPVGEKVLSIIEIFIKASMTKISLFY